MSSAIQGTIANAAACTADTRDPDDRDQQLHDVQRISENTVMTSSLEPSGGLVRRTRKQGSSHDSSLDRSKDD